MKKMLFIAALAIGMVGCTNEEEVVQKGASSQIALQGVTKKATRGGLKDATLPPGANIYCSGLLHNVGNSSSAFHFNNAKFSYEVTTGWKAGDVFWPSDGKLDFWGYTFASYTYTVGNDNSITTNASESNIAAPTATFSKDGLNFSKLELDFENNLKGQNDVMVSNVVEGVECANKATTNHVALNFQHAMAWIVVNIEKGNSADDLMKFYSVTLNDVKLSGKLSVENASTLDFNWTPYRTPGATADYTDSPSFPAYGSSSNPVTLGAAVADPLAGILILPQDQTSITIKYAYKDAAGNYDNILVHNIPLSTLTATKGGNPFDDEDKWKAGYKYIYTITIDSANKKIVLDASVTQFDQIDYTDHL